MKRYWQAMLMLPVFLLAWSGAPSRSQETLSAGQVTVTFDPVQEVYVIRYPAKAGMLQAIYELANKVRPVLFSRVTFDSGTQHFRYQYTVRNESGAKQRILSVRIEAKAPVANEQSVTPIVEHRTPSPGWFFGDPTDAHPFYAWLGTSNQDFIPPGVRLSGFVLVSRGLPGIMRSRFRGATRPDNLHFPDEPPGEVDKLLFQIDERPGNRFVERTTLAPDVLPDGQTPLQLVDRLIALKHQAVDLGWIGRLKPEERDEDEREGRGKRDDKHRRGDRDDREDEERGRGVIRSLDTKLEAAKLHINRGQLKTAANLLHAFIHELEAQRGKHLNENAFFLLKPNAEFILSKLPRREKENDDDDRHRSKRR